MFSAGELTFAWQLAAISRRRQRQNHAGAEICSEVGIFDYIRYAKAAAMAAWLGRRRTPTHIVAVRVAR
jgi:hypothetical protein